MREIDSALECRRIALCKHSVTHQSQFGAVQRWITRFCLLLFLVFTSVEAVHVHPDRALSRNSATPCPICFSAHAKAPVLAAGPLPMLLAVASIVIPYETEAKGIASRLELFTRPPPSV